MCVVCDSSNCLSWFPGSICRSSLTYPAGSVETTKWPAIPLQPVLVIPNLESRHLSRCNLQDLLWQRHALGCWQAGIGDAACPTVPIFEIEKEGCPNGVSQCLGKNSRAAVCQVLCHVHHQGPIINKPGLPFSAKPSRCTSLRTSFL